MKILTFVIPAYNSESFLDKCIPSMLQPEVLSEIEIIVVNDGSKDTTPAVAQKYCDRYPGVVRLISQENKGHGGALNTGCAAAQGKYLKVIDADDWIVGENLPAFVALLEQCNSDVVLTHYHTIDISTGEVKSWKNYPEAFGKDYSFAEIMPQWRSFEHSMSLHGITYRTAFYQQIGHQLTEHVFYEDHEYATYPCCYANGVMPVDLFLYEYRIGDVNQSVSNANQLKRLGHTQTVLRKMTETYKTLPEMAGKQYAAMKIQGLLLSYLTTALLVEPDRKKGRAQAVRVFRECCRRCPEVYDLARWKYQVFLLMNRMHISKQTLNNLMTSRLYALIARKKKAD